MARMDSRDLWSECEHYNDGPCYVLCGIDTLPLQELKATSVCWHGEALQDLGREFYRSAN
jgi:hypothetical protein